MSKLNANYPHKLRVKQLHRRYNRARSDGQRSEIEANMKLLGIKLDREYLKNKEVWG